MFNRLTLLATVGMLVLSLVGCSAPAPTEQPAEPAAAAPEPPPAPAVLYELTTDDITTHPDWTSANVSILTTKIGDKTNDVITNYGARKTRARWRKTTSLSTSETACSYTPSSSLERSVSLKSPKRSRQG